MLSSLVSTYEYIYIVRLSIINSSNNFGSFESKKYSVVLPPLNLLTKDQEKQMMLELKNLDFFPQKNIAA